MLSTCLSANENVASTIVSNILVGELNPVLRVVCYVPSNKFRRICHLRHRAQQFNLSAFCSITCNKHCIPQILPRDFFLQHCTQQILSCVYPVYLSQHCIERNELYHLASFCHIAHQIISCQPFATLRATAYNLCLAHLRARNVIVCLLSATFNLLPF